LSDLILAVALVSAGASYYAARCMVAPDDVSLLPRGSELAIDARVLEVRTAANGRVRAIAAPVGVSGGASPAERRPVSGLAWLSWPDGSQPPREGDVVTVRGEASAPPGLRNPLGFDFRRYLRNRGVTATLHAESVELLARRSVRGALLARIEAIIDRDLRGESGSVLTGLLLGKTGELPDELMRSFRRSGTVHILSVSGLHVGFVALIVYAILRCLRMGPRLARSLVVPSLAGLVFLIGPGPPVVRSSIMAAVFTISGTLERRTNSVNTLGVAALTILILAPGSAFDLGFQLSFGATLGMVLLFREIRDLLAPLLRWAGALGARLADSIAVSASAQLGVAPVLIAVWGNLSVIAPLSNLAVVPLAGFATAAGIAMLATDPFLPGLARAFAASGWASLRLLAGSATLSASPSWASVSVACRFWPSVLAGTLALVWAFRARTPCARLAGFGGLAVCSLALALAAHAHGPGRSRPRVIFFDVGQGDAILLEIPRNHYVLIDTGPGGTTWGGRDAGRDVVAPYLAKTGAGRLDALVVTHAHDDHSGGLAAVVAATTPREILVSRGVLDEPRCAAILETARQAGVDVREARPGDVLWAGGGDTVRVVATLCGDAANAPPENDRSLIVAASLGGLRLLFTGDIEKAGEASLLETGRSITADILKVPHHGGSASSSRALLEAVHPSLSVVSVGIRNRFGHPSAGALARIRDAGSTILRTDEDGAILVEMEDGRACVWGIASRARIEIQPRRAETWGPTATRE
jgi:competence protein ComEC